MKINYIFSALLLSVMILPVSSFSQSQGPNNPSAAISVSAPMGTPWTNPTSVFTSNSNVAVAPSLNTFPNCAGQTCYYSTGLQATGFGFTIPLTANIDGIVVDVQRMAMTANIVFDSTLQIVKNAVPVGTNYASSVAWGTPNIYTSYGSSTDLWGTAWTPADINNVNFGVYLSVSNSSASIQTNAGVDHIRITVYYTAAVGINYPASSANELFTVHSVSPGQIEVNYHLSSSAKGKLSMMNVLGEIIFSKEINSAEGTELIDVQVFPAEVYFVRIAVEEKIYTKKIVIQ